MRLWTIHPKYLDRQGLLALWREALLAQAVIQGRTRGYRNHPQLQRFNAQPSPLEVIGAYLQEIHAEASARGYNFDPGKIASAKGCVPIPATRGQVEFERRHLLAKLKKRSPDDYQGLISLQSLEPHPLFKLRAGPIEAWEKGLHA